MLRVLAIFVLALMAGALASQSSAAERRVALIIGNGQYANTVKLPNPPADARAVAAKLKDLGFEVTAGYDLSVRDMQTLVSKFSTDAATADVAFVFYAGHGMQVDNINWLIPTDANLHNTTELKFQAIKADDILDALPPEPAVRILVLDACRDNPFQLTLPRGARGIVGRGLAPMSVPSLGGTGGGTLIVYSTDVNQVALDSVGGLDSPFTTALVRSLDTPDTDIQSMLTLVESNVKTVTHGQQSPWHYASMNQIFKLKPAAEAKPPQQVASLPPPPPPASELVRGPSEEWQKESALWEYASKDASPAAYQAYLDKYPDGQFAALAKAKLDAASKAPPAAPSTPEPVPVSAPTTSPPVAPAPAPIEIPPAVRTTEATEGMEVDMKMSQTDRSNVQRRLTALQFSTGGTDGAFGPMTRAAIKGWQRGNGIVESGFLNQPQYDLLIRMSDAALSRSPTAVAEVPGVTRTVVIAPTPSRPRYYGRVVEYRPRVHYYRARPYYSSGSADAGAFFGGIIGGILRH